MRITVTVVDEDPPICAGCQQALEEVVIDVDVHFGTGEVSYSLGPERYRWARGMGVYLVAPGTLRWVTEGWGTLSATCPSCQAPVALEPDPELLAGTHALRPHRPQQADIAADRDR